MTDVDVHGTHHPEALTDGKGLCLLLKSQIYDTKRSH